MAYDKGELVDCRGEFRDQTDTLVDPTVVRFKFETPAAVETTYTYGVHPQLVRESVGRYLVAVDANAPGTWRYRFESTGTYQGADEATFNVRTSVF